jgi:hypothetical protein
MEGDSGPIDEKMDDEPFITPAKNVVVLRQHKAKTRK